MGNIIGGGFKRISPDPILGLAPDVYLKSGDYLLNGSNASQWNDSSGNNRHFTQSITARQPLVSVDSAGKQTLRFDGVDDLLILNEALYNTSEANATVFVLFEALNDSDGTLITIRPNALNAGWLLRRININQLSYQHVRILTFNTAGSTGRYVAGFRRQGLLIDVMVNNNIVGTQTFSRYTATTDSLTAVGTDRTDGSTNLFTHANITAIATFPKALEVSEISVVINELNN